MNRAAALLYLRGEFGTLLTEAAIPIADTDPGVRGVLDGAFRLLGVAVADLPTATVAESDSEKLETALDYVALRRISRAVAAHVNISKQAAGAAISKSRGAIPGNVAMLLALAEKRLKSYGLIPGGAVLVRLNLDFLEPVVTSDY